MAFVDDSTWATLHLQSPPMIVWEQQGHPFGSARYTYGALFIQATQTWYLAGDAEYYGSREIGDSTMRQLIEDPDVETWWYNQQWRKGT
jgi:hypothetical protein